MYAVIDLEGKQQKIEVNEVVRIDKLDNEIGDEIEFTKVMLIKNSDGELSIGAPYIENAKVTAKVLNQDRDKKILVFKKKRRKSYDKMQGHRQDYTEIQIKEILLG